MKSHKIPGIDKNICNCEQKIAYNYLFAYYVDFETKEKIVNFVKKVITDQIKAKYNCELIIDYIYNSFDRYKNNDMHIFTSYEDVGKIIFI